MEKKYIDAEVEEFKIPDDPLYGPLEDVIKNLQSRFDMYTLQGWKNLFLKVEGSWDYSEMKPFGKRPENDVEFEYRKTRVKAKEKRKQKKLEMDKTLYEKLKKQFDK